MDSLRQTIRELTGNVTILSVSSSATKTKDIALESKVKELTGKVAKSEAVWTGNFTAEMIGIANDLRTLRANYDALKGKSKSNEVL